MAVIVPATDAAPHLPDCLAALEAAQPGPDEVIVVREPTGAGPAAARNEGAARATADILLFVDSDVAVHPDAIGRIRAHFAGDLELTAVFGSYDDSPSAPGAVAQFRNLLHHTVHNDNAGAAETFWAGLGAVRRDAFVAAGGFDDRRFARPSVEDVELGARLHTGGARIELDPRICGRHLKSWSLVGMVRTDFLHRGLPWTRLLLDGTLQPRGLNLGTRHRASAIASVAVVYGLLTRRPRTTSAAAVGVLVLNRRLYALVGRRAGHRAAVAAPALHILHHLTAVAAAATAAAEHVASRIARRR